MPKRNGSTVWLLVLLIGMILMPTVARGQEPLRVVISEVRSADFPYVKAFVTVTDAGGKIIRDVTRDKFSVLEDGRNVPVTDVQVADPNDLSLAVALVIDASGSMKGEPLEKAKSAAISFVNSLAQNDVAAIVVFSDTARVTQDFTSDKQVLINAIQMILPGEYTCLFDGTYYGLRAVAEQKTDRRAVVVMTDGAECGNDDCTAACSTFSEDDCITKAKESNIPIHTIGFRDKVVEPPLIRLAESTHGSYRRADISNLEQVYQDIATQLKYEYIVSFESRLPHDRQGHSLTVDVVVGSGTGQDITTFPAARTEPTPILKIPGIVDGQEYTETLEIVPEIISREPVDRVVYQINDAGIFTATASPWSYSWDPEKAEEEENRFNVVAYDTAGTASAPVQFTLKAPPPEEQDGADKTLYYIIGGAAGALLLGGGFLALTRGRKQPLCPNCGRAIPAGMVECPFCAQDATPLGSSGGGSSQPSTAWELPTASGQQAMPGGGPIGPSATQPYGAGPGAGQPQPIQRTVMIQRAPQVTAWLVVERGERQGQLFRMEKDELNIGRHPGNDIPLSDGTTSAQHAKLRIVGKEVFIQDLASTNGTFVNGEKILKHTLADNDRITIGNTTFVFKRTEVQK